MDDHSAPHPLARSRAPTACGFLLSALLGLQRLSRQATRQTRQSLPALSDASPSSYIGDIVSTYGGGAVIPEELLSRFKSLVAGTPNCHEVAGVPARTLRSWVSGERQPTLQKFFEALARIQPEPKVWLRLATPPFDLDQLLLTSSPQNPRFFAQTIRPIAASISQEPRSREHLAVLADIETVPEHLEHLEPETLLAIIEYVDLEVLSNDPKRALRISRRLILQSKRLLYGHIHLFAASLGLFASANRSLGRLSVATLALRLATNQAINTCNRQLLARLYRRLASVLDDRSQFQDALSVSKEAHYLYLELGELEHAGRTMVDIGTYLLASGDYGKAVPILRQAWEAVNEPMHRLGALFNLSRAYCHLRRFRDAEAALDRLELMTTDAQPSFKATILTQRAELLESTGELQRAVSMYARAARIFREINPLYAAYALISRLLLLAELKDYSNLPVAAGEIVFILQPAASDSETPLLRCALAIATATQPSASMLEQLRAAIQQTTAARQ